MLLYDQIIIVHPLLLLPWEKEAATVVIVIVVVCFLFVFLAREEKSTTVVFGVLARGTGAATTSERIYGVSLAITGIIRRTVLLANALSNTQAVEKLAPGLEDAGLVFKLLLAALFSGVGAPGVFEEVLVFSGHDDTLDDGDGHLGAELEARDRFGVVDVELFAESHGAGPGDVGCAAGDHPRHEAVDVAVVVFGDDAVADGWWDDPFGLVSCVETLLGLLAGLALEFVDFALAEEGYGADGYAF